VAHIPVYDPVVVRPVRLLGILDLHLRISVLVVVLVAILFPGGGVFIFVFVEYPSFV